MRGRDYKDARARRRYIFSGGALKVPRSPAERLVLEVKRARLKADFLRREAVRRETVA